MYEIRRYNQSDKLAWNKFVQSAKNPSMLFERDYMDYHSDRFTDYSLIVYHKGKICAVLPANEKECILYSHQGLTYGGLIMSMKLGTSDVLSIFRAINDYLESQGIKKVIYKPTPYIYHELPAQEDLYALFRLTNAQVVGRQISSTIYLHNKIKFTESRKSGIRKAKKSGISVRRSDDFGAFWKILESNLHDKYGVKPVHTYEEIKLLSSLFPERIRLYSAISKDGDMLGATVIYIINNRVIHTQYISASHEGKELGALDLLFDYLINEEFKDYQIFDFGQSTEQRGSILNESLIFQKEGFGGRGVLYDIYEYDL